MNPVLKPFFYAVLSILVLGFTVSARADESNPNDYLHTRTYIGILGTSVSLNKSGEFTGTNYSRSTNPLLPYEVDLIPSIAQNFGFGALIGHREEAYAVEISYWQSNHVASFGPGVVGSVSGASATFTGVFQDQAVFHAINVDFKRYFLTELQLQPFINLGVSFPWLVVNNAAAGFNDGVLPSDPNYGKYTTSSLTLAGLGLNLGLGVEYYLTPNISVTGGAYQRWASFDQARGLAGEYNQLAQYGNPTSDEGSGLNFAVGTTVGF